MARKSRAVRIFGSGKVDAGTHSYIRSFGDMEIAGDIDALGIRAFGDILLRGRCATKQLFSAGNLHALDTITAGAMRAFGDVVVDGQLNADSLNVMGGITVSGRVTSQQFRLWGEAILGGDLIADRIRLSGECEILGLVSADLVRIRSRKHCQIDEIGGETIHVLAGRYREGIPDRRGFLKWLFGCKGTSQVRLIEGDMIRLENTAAKLVRGRSITLGPGCRISTVEYSETLTQHPLSVVEVISKS